MTHSMAEEAQDMIIGTEPGSRHLPRTPVGGRIFFPLHGAAHLLVSLQDLIQLCRQCSVYLSPSQGGRSTFKHFGFDLQANTQSRVRLGR